MQGPEGQDFKMSMESDLETMKGFQNLANMNCFVGMSQLVEYQAFTSSSSVCE